MSNLPLTRAQISIDSLLHNMRLLKEIAGGRPLWPAIKADAYGHGSEIIARGLIEAGFTTLCVAHVGEALQLAEGGIEARFIILSPDLGDTAPEIAARGFEPVVCTELQLEKLSQAAVSMKAVVRVHLKFDTGMGRAGFDPALAVEVAERASVLPGIEVASAMSHFPRADEADKAYSHAQIGRFREVTQRLCSVGVHSFHMANSAAIFDLPESHFDLCRPGISIYGLKPSAECLNPRVADLRPVLRWSTRITQLKEVPAGTGLSYGHTFRTRRPSLIATVPIGYGDGLMRLLSNRMEFLVQGVRSPQVGRICMDQSLIDVTALRGRVSQGDEAVVIGSQGEGEISADELAATLGTINYEIVTQIANRVPRLRREPAGRTEK